MNIVEYAEFLVNSIAPSKDMVKVTSYEDDNETIIDILVPESDMGAVIGHAGKNAKAIRTVIQAFATIHEVGRVKINIDSF